MRPILQSLCVAGVLVAVGAMYGRYWLRRADPSGGPRLAAAVGDRACGVSSRARSTTLACLAPTLATFPDPNAHGTSARVFSDPAEFDGGVFDAAGQSTRSAISDPPADARTS